MYKDVMTSGQQYAIEIGLVTTQPESRWRIPSHLSSLKFMDSRIYNYNNWTLGNTNTASVDMGISDISNANHARIYYLLTT